MLKKIENDEPRQKAKKKKMQYWKTGDLKKLLMKAKSFAESAKLQTKSIE